jgi:Uma2 family endonuclease
MSTALEVPVERHRLTRAQYETMIDAGVFGPEEKLELLDGELIDMVPQKSRHATATTLLARELASVFGDGYFVRVQLPFNLDQRSVPEPDIAVVPGVPRDYTDEHPSRAALIVEVADSSLAYDRMRKYAAYGRAGVPEYWILNLNAQALEVHTRPDVEGYQEKRVLRAGDSVTPGAAPSAIPVADLLP